MRVRAASGARYTRFTTGDQLSTLRVATTGPIATKRSGAIRDGASILREVVALRCRGGSLFALSEKVPPVTELTAQHKLNRYYSK
jgi:hypothetical protein